MSGFLALLQILLADLRRRPATALATVLAMAAGVGVFVAIQLAGAAARSSFVSAVEAIAGRGTHEITRPGGLPEERFAAIATADGVESAQPIVEGWVRVLAVDGRPAPVEGRDLPPLRLLGIDPFFVVPFLGPRSADPIVREDEFVSFLVDPGAALLPRTWASENGVVAGDRLRVGAAGRRSELRVLAVYELEVLGEAARDTALVDLASAQEVLGRLGTLDRVDLIVEDGAEAKVRSSLAPGERLERPERRGERVGKMTEAFRLNLLALGGLALLVGALLVYSAAQFNVVRRTGLFGQLRILGASRGAILFVALGEVMLLGLAGGIVGVAIGTALAQGLVRPVAETITNLYAFLRVETAPLRPLVAAAAIGGSIVVAAAAALFPALDAARTPPRLVGIRSRGETRARAAIPRLCTIGGIAVVAGIVLMRVPTGRYVPGFLASFAFLVAGASLLPPIMAPTLPLLRAAGERTGRFALALAAGAISRSLSRTGGAAAALGVALSMTIGVLVMVGSFEREVTRWIAGILTADLYVSDANDEIAHASSRLPEEAVARIRRAPGVRSVDTRRSLDLALGERTILFNGFDWADPARQIRTREFLEGGDDVLDRLRAGEVLVSQPLSERFGLHRGDLFEVEGPVGPRSFRIAGVVRDYSNDRGYALALADIFVRAFGDPGIRNLGLFLEDGIDPEDAARTLRRELAGEFLLQIRSNRELRSEVIRVFERTFAVTTILQVIATGMALAGIAVTLVGLYLERAREIATLRALGTPAIRIGHLFAVESLLLALFPTLVALPLGAVLAWILIHVVNLRSFGWSFGYHWPWGAVLGTCALAAAAGLSATAVPLLLTRRQSLAAALREE